MNDMTLCGNHEALIAYLYGEADPAEREAVAAHLVMCVSCSEELQALKDTRAHLGAWVPPALPLGFQITRTDSDLPGKVLRPAAFWKRPLPAWAQVAAAVAIFAAGMSVDRVRSAGETPARVITQAPVAQPVTATSPVAAEIPSVTRAEFARLEARLRSIENGDQRVSAIARTTGAVPDNELSGRIAAIEDRISESERQNLRTFATLVRAVEENRRDIVASREATQRVSLMEEELQDHRQVLRNAVVPALAVRTALQGGGR